MAENETMRKWRGFAAHVTHDPLAYIILINSIRVKFFSTLFSDINNSAFIPLHVYVCIKSYTFQNLDT